MHLQNYTVLKLSKSDIAYEICCYYSVDSQGAVTVLGINKENFPGSDVKKFEDSDVQVSYDRIAADLSKEGVPLEDSIFVMP